MAFMMQFYLEEIGAMKLDELSMQISYVIK